MQNTFIVCHFCSISFAWHALSMDFVHEAFYIRRFFFYFSYIQVYFLILLLCVIFIRLVVWCGKLTLFVKLKVQLFGFIEQFWFYYRIEIAIAHHDTFQIGWLYMYNERRRLKEKVIINDDNGMYGYFEWGVSLMRVIEKWCSLFSISVDLRLH